MARDSNPRHAAGVDGPAWSSGFLIFFPILWMFLTSFKTELDAFAMPPKFLFFHWTLENYAEVQERSNYLALRAQLDPACRSASNARRPPDRRSGRLGDGLLRRASAPRTS